jgi:AraC-like DNA-binding protein
MNGEAVPPETIYVPPKPVVTRTSSNIDAVEHRETAVIIGYILRNLHKKSLSVADIIRETGIPQGKLYYCFEKHIGRPIAAYIAAKRIEKAAALVKTTGMKSEEIADQCGFSDLKHFLRTLKRVKGLKFSEFRDQYTHDPDAVS